MKYAALILLLILPTVAFAQCTGSPCQVGPGQTYTTIAACLSVATAGQTCNVHTSTYTENPSVPAGTVGNYITLQANGSDTVTISGGITLASHTKVVGNCPALQGTITTAVCGFFITNASSPTTACVTMPSGITDYFFQGNDCYDTGGVNEQSGTPPVNGYILQNNFSYNCGPVASPNTCTPLNIRGDHKIVENNDVSHFNNCSKILSGQFIVFRGNNCHDAHTNETGSNSGGDNHIDFSEFCGGCTASRSLFEANQENNCFVDGGGGVGGSPACHGGPLGQCGGGTCGQTIWRFHLDYHIQGSAVTFDQGNWPNGKFYNNSWVDMQNGVSGGFTTNNQQNEQSGANLNEIYYYVTPNPTGGNAGSAYHYSASPGSSNFGNNLAWCPNQSSSACNAGVFSHNGASFTTDTGNVVCDPTFVNSASDFHLQAGSCALNAGVWLTTVANTDAGSGVSLTVNDANYFQDGWGLPAGSGLGQMMPDCIAVTTVSNHVCINAGGINYSTNILTLASGITRAVGDHVWLYSDSKGTVRLTGTAPNIGAFGLAPAGGAAGSQLQGGTTLSGGTTLQ